MVRDAIARLMGRKAEDRAYNYTTDILVNELRQARSATTEALVTACSNAARLTALTMARGQVSLDGMLADYWRGEITKDWIFQAAYDVLMHGDSVYKIDADSPTGGMLDRAGTFEVRGKRRPYRYQLDVSHPDGQDTHRVSETEALHLRLGADKSRPWRGRSVFADVLLRSIEKGLVDLARLPTQRVVNYPRNRGHGIDAVDEGGAKMIDDAWNSKLSRAGLVNLVDNSGPRGTPQAVPHVDLKFTSDPAAVELRRDLVVECFAAVGYPPALLSGETPGQTVRQEFTRWVVGVLQPMADIMAGQIADALEVDCSWSMDPARIPLALDQSTVVKNLKAAGVPVDRAVEIAGLS